MAGTSSCQPTYIIGGGQTFVLRNVETGGYLSAFSTYPLKQIYTSPTDSRLWFTYNTTTLQIKSAYSGLCLDDLGHGYSPQSSTFDTLGFNLCTESFTQQFVYQPGNKWLLNPNNPYDKCLDGNPSYSAIYGWYCPYGGTNHQWTVILICPSGIVISSLRYSPESSLLCRQSHEHCGRHQLFHLPRWDLQFNVWHHRQLHPLSGRKLLSHRLFSGTNM